jgi:phospholipase/lecithinase/hemolysin
MEARRTQREGLGHTGEGNGHGLAAHRHQLLEFAVIRELLIFGDSLSDGGNARARLGDRAFPCPPHWADRRCDGPLWVDHLAARLALPTPTPSTAGGHNHAHGGARSGWGASPKGMPNLLRQVAGVLESRGEDWLGRSVDREEDGLADSGLEHPPTLVVLRAGANDYLDAPLSPAIGDAVNQHLLTAVEALADQGLRHFLVPNELPWGLSPIALPGLGEPQRRELNRLIQRQNDALRRGLEELAARRKVVVFQPDVHGLVREVHAAPEAWGFRDVGQPALESGVLDAHGFLWWDAWGHLTSAFHRLMAERAVGEIRNTLSSRGHKGYAAI